MTLLKPKFFIAATAVLAFAFSAPLPAQAQAQDASIHGHVNNAAGQVLTSGDVKFTKDKAAAFKDEKFAYSFPIDGSGNYKGTGIAPGDYRAVVVEDAKSVDFQDVTLKAGEDATLDFDMTRAAYINGMTPEQKKELEEYKKKNAEVMSSNQIINKLNATLKTVRADLTAAAPTKGDVSADVTDMKQAVDAKPDTGLLWITYGDTLQAQGDHMAAADKAASKPAMSDDAVLKEYADAADAYKKGIDVEAASKKPAPDQEAASYNQMGNALAKEGKTTDATAAFESAAKVDPSKAGMYYHNEAAIEFNAGQNDAALAAAEKAIAANPNGPDPYFIKGQVLIAKSSFDAKTQKLTAPPGCVEAYEKYLQLAPDGAQAPAVREVLQSLGEKIDTRYKAGRKPS